MTRAPILQQARARMREATIAALRTACARAVRDPARIEAVVLFGSLARGDFDGLSDIDVAVIGDRAAFDSAVFLDLDRAVDMVQVAPERWHDPTAAATDDMLSVLRAEAVPLWP